VDGTSGVTQRDANGDKLTAIYSASLTAHRRRREVKTAGTIEPTTTVAAGSMRNSSIVRGLDPKLLKKSYFSSIRALIKKRASRRWIALVASGEKAESHYSALSFSAHTRMRP
jgi:hypothetical protein